MNSYQAGELKNGLPAPRGYNDVCFAILFWLHVIAVLALAVYGGKSMSDANALDPAMKMKMMVRCFSCFSERVFPCVCCVYVSPKRVDFVQQENMNPLAGLNIPWDLIS